MKYDKGNGNNTINSRIKFYSAQREMNFRNISHNEFTSAINFYKKALRCVGRPTHITTDCTQVINEGKQSNLFD